MAAGEGSLFAKRHNWHPGFRNPLRTLSNILHPQVAADDLLIPDITQWYASYPCGMYNTSLIPPRWVAPHLVRLSEERFVLNSVYNLVYRLLECHIHPPHLHFQFLHPEILHWSRGKNALPGMIQQWGLALILQPIIFETLILLNTPHKLPHILGRSFCQRLP